MVGMLTTFMIMAKASKGYDKAKKRRAERGPAVPCSTCGSTMTFVGLQKFNTQGGLLDELATDDDGWLEVEVHRCPTCRKLELFLPPAAG